jgi:hypothetical protein
MLPFSSLGVESAKATENGKRFRNSESPTPEGSRFALVAGVMRHAKTCLFNKKKITPEINAAGLRVELCLQLSLPQLLPS